MRDVVHVIGDALHVFLGCQYESTYVKIFKEMLCVCVCSRLTCSGAEFQRAMLPGMVNFIFIVVHPHGDATYRLTLDIKVGRVVWLRGLGGLGLSACGCRG